MANGGKDKNYVSFWFWFFALFLIALPCIGWILILIFAFMGENASRKNYFRALIAWALLALFSGIILLALGMIPVLAQPLQDWFHHLNK